MYPIMLDLTKSPVALIGEGAALLRRLRELKEAGASELTVYSAATDVEADELHRFYPDIKALESTRIVMIVGLDDMLSAELATRAKCVGALVNVEDKPALCDFYFTSQVRRGDLVFAISTAGKSPTLAKILKQYVSLLFHDQWKQYVADLGVKRLEWKGKGYSMREVESLSRDYIDEQGWMRPLNERLS